MHYCLENDRVMKDKTGENLCKWVNIGLFHACTGILTISKYIW